MSLGTSLSHTVSRGAQCVVSSSLPAQRIDDDASVHDRLLWAIHLSGMDDLLLFLSSSSAEQQWSLHVLEIVSLMFRDQVRSYVSLLVPAMCFCTTLVVMEHYLRRASDACPSCVFHQRPINSPQC